MVGSRTIEPANGLSVNPRDLQAKAGVSPGPEGTVHEGRAASFLALRTAWIAKASPPIPMSVKRSGTNRKR
jgi:hypothetical protein